MNLEPRFLATAIGSLPHEDAGEACRLMLAELPEMPVWPQLPKRSFHENMYVQYSEGLPGIRIDESAERIWFQVDDDLPGELEGFYQAVIDEDLERFAMTDGFAAGLILMTGGEFEEELSGRPYLKGQVTGPISFGLTVTDQNKRASLYDETIEEVIVKGLALKARWQSEMLREAQHDAGVVLFFDEPYLVSVGSALLSVSREQVVDDINECIKTCRADITGVHCCGNTDWSLVFATDVDIVNFDAYDYMEGFLAYDKEIDAHIKGGGAIAWGIVPDTEKVLGVTGESLAGSVEEAFDTLEKRGVDRGLLAKQSMISPACGLGPTTIEAAERALAMTGEVSGILRERYF